MAFYEIEHSKNTFTEARFNISENLTFHAHMHRSFELIAVKTGEICLWVENEKYVLKRNDIALIMPNTVHRYLTPDFSRIVLAIFPVSYIPELYDDTKKGIMHVPYFSSEESFIDELYESQNDSFLFRSIIYKIAYFYKKNPELCSDTARDGSFAYAIASYFEKNCCSEMNEKMLANEMGYHPRYMSYLINQTFGVSFKQLLNEYRIRKASEMLQNEELNITEIYLAAGFTSQSTFNRNFKKIIGITPKEYRGRN
ncbi:MAG: helix-turn-helix domain-containing protein [Ruminococcaceae bacterium]|nr:helix-turn-helix domain-containing protein [Oscillospiraceae bacterium]